MINVLGKPMRGPSALTRLVLLVALSAALMMLDHRGQQLERVRSVLMLLVYPIQAVAGAPVALYHGVLEAFTSERALRQANARLETERLQLAARLQQLEALEAENERLRALLGAAARVADRVLVAELAAVSLEPFSRRLLLRRGSRDGVYAGQPVLDAHGVVGQITDVSPHSSTVTLITDPSHAIPVIDNRSGLRALVFGSGDQETLTVPYLSALADIQVGDLLVTSGMGGTFPPGYPVAVVTEVKNDPRESFLLVRARPAARLNHGKQVLLIWPAKAPAALAREAP
jgi:rod shape-determining protein MreC